MGKKIVLIALLLGTFCSSARAAQTIQKDALNAAAAQANFKGAMAASNNAHAAAPVSVPRPPAAVAVHNANPVAITPPAGKIASLSLPQTAPSAAPVQERVMPSLKGKKRLCPENAYCKAVLNGAPAYCESGEGERDCAVNEKFCLKQAGLRPEKRDAAYAQYCTQS